MIIFSYPSDYELGGIILKLEYRVVRADKRSPKGDVTKALDIYIKNVDEGSLTNTNQILDYIYITLRIIRMNLEKCSFIFCII